MGIPATRFGGVRDAKVTASKVNAIVCIPTPQGSVAKMLIDQICEAEIKGPIKVPRKEDSCTPSLRVPRQTLNPAYLGLSIYFIKWQR